MALHEIRTAAMIGAGNLGWHLGQALNKKGVSVLQVISKSEKSSKSLARILKCNDSTNLKACLDSVDIVIIAVPDSEIPGVINQLESMNSMIVHTAGSVTMQIFKDKTLNYGVLYPLMTFTREKPVNFSDIPILIEANTDENTEKLKHLTGLLSQDIRIMNSDQRLLVHLAAVFASNFSNHMYTLAEFLLKQNGISFDLLKPLIRETTEKIGYLSPLKSQTGPAVRNDKQTMESHLKMLAGDAQIAELYRHISKSIITFAAKGKHII